jgi:hypothetical protein
MGWFAFWLSVKVGEWLTAFSTCHGFCNVINITCSS